MRIVLACVMILLTAFEAVEEARVVEVIDGDTVVLEDGRQVRLVGIQAPKLALGRPGFRAWPSARFACGGLCPSTPPKAGGLWKSLRYAVTPASQ